MAHDHTHDHSVDYRLEQLCTLGICGALGGVAILLYQQGTLKYILADKFHLWVLVGGIALLVLVAVRAVALGASVRAERQAGCHEHDHEHDLGHGHAHAEACPGHDHSGAAADCGHDHGWNPWRFAVLLLPVVLFLLKMPNQGFSNVRDVSTDQVDLHASGDALVSALSAVGLASPSLGAGPLGGAVALVAGGGRGSVGELGFRELEQAAFSPDQRDYFEGKRAEIRGQFAPSNDPRTFTLVRFKINCCAADLIPLNVLIRCEEPVRRARNEWVKVGGTIHFAKRRDRDEFIPVLHVDSAKDVVKVDPDRNPYIQ
jgi:hypothetical protein